MTARFGCFVCSHAALVDRLFCSQAEDQFNFTGEWGASESTLNAHCFDRLQPTMAASDVPRMSCQFACLCHVRVTDLVSRGKQYLGPKGCALLRSADGSRFSLLLYAPVTKKHDFLFSIESRFWFSSSAGVCCPHLTHLLSSP